MQYVLYQNIVILLETEIKKRYLRTKFVKEDLVWTDIEIISYTRGPKM